MSAELQQLADIYGPKVVDLRTLFAFRLLPKKKNAKYKKTVGEAPSDEQSKLILWNFLDLLSKQQASNEGVDKMKFHQMEKLIDKRFKIHFGNLDYKPGRDDPMGLVV